MPMTPRRAWTAVALIVLRLDSAKTAADPAASSPHGIGPPLLRRLRGRSLQACPGKARAFAACMNDGGTVAEAERAADCGACINAFEIGPTTNGTVDNCAAAGQRVCGALIHCPCLSPCRVQFENYAMCLWKQELANEGIDVTCELDCGSAGEPSFGSAAGGGSDSLNSTSTENRYATNDGGEATEASANGPSVVVVVTVSFVAFWFGGSFTLWFFC